MTKFIKVTRVYIKNKGTECETLKTQPVSVSVSSIESFRPRNAVGSPSDGGNRCTIVTKSGKYINVKEKFSEVQRLLADA